VGNVQEHLAFLPESPGHGATLHIGKISAREERDPAMAFMSSFEGSTLLPSLDCMDF